MKLNECYSRLRKNIGCGACRGWVTGGWIHNSCDCCFHINRASTSFNLLGESMPWDCMSHRYQKYVSHQARRRTWSRN